jgi:hypothetical protein
LFSAEDLLVYASPEHIGGSNVEQAPWQPAAVTTERSRKLCVEAAHLRAGYAVALFAVLDTRVTTAQTLQESRRYRLGLQAISGLEDPRDDRQ